MIRLTEHQHRAVAYQTSAQLHTHQVPVLLGRLLRIISLGISTLLLACSPNQSPKTAEQPTPKNPNDLAIITPDWGIASTLAGIGNPPVATGDLNTLPEWSISPKLPDDTVDLGARFTPNPELSAQLSADLFIYSGFYSHLQSGATKVYEYKGVQDKHITPPTWEDYKAAVMALGKTINQEQETLDYISQTERHLVAQGYAFKQKYPDIHRLVLVQFGNANQLYNYTRATPFGPTLDKMGIEIVDLGASNQWGSYVADISELTTLDKNTCLIIVKPFSTLLKKELSKHALWQYLGYERGERCAMVVQPAWAFGDLASMAGLADNLLTATPYTQYGIGTTVKEDK